MFFLSFLLLVFVSISVSGDNAFAKSGTADNPVEVANLICSLSTTIPPTFTVVALSRNSNAGVTPAPAIGDECADLGVLFAGLNIRDVHSVAPNYMEILSTARYSVTSGPIDPPA